MPFSRKRSFLFVPAPLLLLLCACHGGGGSTDEPDVPLSNIDLKVTNFTVSPDAADPEDAITVSGTIQNLGTETANPVLGDKFLVGFNLSQDGTFELDEQGFLQVPISAPIPPGESLDFSYTVPYGDGDTLSVYADFCTSDDCVPPETGVIGVKADFVDAIGERDEGNNFDFKTIEVVGTRVAVTSAGCNFGTLQGPEGCDLQITDGVTLENRHLPTSSLIGVLFRNELRRFVYGSVNIIGCEGLPTCGGSYTITATTQKPGLPASIKSLTVQCTAYYPDIDKACPVNFEIRDPTY